MPSLQKMVSQLKMSFKTSFETHLRSRGYSTVDLWAQIDEIITTLTLENEKNILEKTREFGEPENFFELVRFDFLIDEDLGVHLMEVSLNFDERNRRNEVFNRLT